MHRIAKQKVPKVVSLLKMVDNKTVVFGPLRLEGAQRMYTETSLQRQHLLPKMLPLE